MVAATKYTTDDVLSAAAQVIVQSGIEGASVAAIARHLGAPSGSIYHRFASKQHLIGALWVRIASDYRNSLVEALTSEPIKSLPGSIVDHTFDWVEQHPIESALLMRFRTEDFVNGDWPAKVIEAITIANQTLATAIFEFAATHGIDPLDMTLATIDVPAAAARRWILLDDPGAQSHIRKRATELVAVLLGS